MKGRSRRRPDGNIAIPGMKDGGGWGIRTPEGLHPTRFPSVRHRPLGESSRRSTSRLVQQTRNISDAPDRVPIDRTVRGGGIGHPCVTGPTGRGAGAPSPSGTLSPGPSCGVIQRIPQDRKVARVSGLWRVHGGSLRSRAHRLPWRRRVPLLSAEDWGLEPPSPSDHEGAACPRSARR